MKSLLATITILTMVGMVVGIMVKAVDEKSVTATVTVSQISISISPGTVAYLTLGVTETEDTTSSGVNATQTVTNNGNVNVDLDIKGTTATPQCTWTLAATQGDEQYFHKYCNSGTGSPDVCDADPVWNVLTTTYAQFDTGVIPTGTSKFDLQVGVPNTTTCTEAENVNVWVQAS